MNHQIDINDREFLEKKYGKLTTWVPGAIDQKTGKINPQVTQVYLGGTTFASLFHVKPVYYETYTGHWRPLSEVTVHHGNHKIEFNSDWWKVHPRYMAWLEKRMQLIGGKLLIPSLFQDVPSPYTGVLRELHKSLVPVKIGLTTSTFYPDPNTETTTVDGHVAYDNTTWATARTAATGNGVSDSNTIFEFQTTLSSGTYVLKRSFTLFDTSSITDTDTIDSATYSTYVTNCYNSNNMSNVLVETTPASNTALSTADYDAVGSTSFGSYAHPAGFPSSPNTYWNITVNASGLAIISKTGVTKYGIRVSGDINDIAPSGGSEKYNQGVIISADTSGTSTDPKLVVVHTAGSSFTPTPMMHMMQASCY